MDFDFDELSEIAIPVPRSFDGWQDLTIHRDPTQDVLVPIGLGSGRYAVLHCEPAYMRGAPGGAYSHGIQRAIDTVFLRPVVADQLLAMERALPSGLHLMVLDGWRPRHLQQHLFETFKAGLVRQLELRKIAADETELLPAIERFVTRPSTNADRPAVHNTGGAVDVVVILLPDAAELRVAEIDEMMQQSDPTPELELERRAIIRTHGRMLDIGVPFDHAGPESTVDHYEHIEAPDEHQQMVKENRRFVFHVFRLSGFVEFPSEIWHINHPSTQMGAKIDGGTPTFGALELSKENHAFIQRKGRYAGKVRLPAEGFAGLEMQAHSRRAASQLLLMSRLEPTPSQVDTVVAAMGAKN